MDEEVDWLDLIERFGLPVAIFILILWTGYKRIWVWGAELKASEKREQEWRELALTGTKIAETVAANSSAVASDLEKAIVAVIERSKNGP